MVAKPAVACWVRLALPAALNAAASPAYGDAYDWNGDVFSKSGVPNPLAPPDTATMQDLTSDPVCGVSFLNKSRFSYRYTNLILADGVTVTYVGTWTSLDDHGQLRVGSSSNRPKFVNIGSSRRPAADRH